jgi:hypothetical protein
MIKNECKRLLCSKGMLMGMMIGLAIVLWHQVIYVWNPNMDLDNGLCMENVYYNWLGGNCGQLQTFLFYFILPILAALPTGYSYFEDYHSGYIYHFSVRGKKQTYLLGKMLATFLSGALVVIIPLVVSFVLTAMRFPLLYPEPVMGLGPDLLSFDIALYYQHPIVHTILFILADGIFAGGMALFVLTGTFMLHHRFSVMITPFVIYYFLFSLDQILGKHDYSPNYFLIPGFSPHLWWEFLLGFVVLAGNAVVIYFVGKKI